MKQIIYPNHLDPEIKHGNNKERTDPIKAIFCVQFAADALNEDRKLYL